MSGELSTRPYLIRAIYEWCVDGALTPYLAVRVDAQTDVPHQHVKDGQIVLNLSASAVRKLEIGNESISCVGRFNGSPYDLFIPVAAVMGIFAKENGQGLVFQTEEPAGPVDSGTPASKPTPEKKISHLKIVK